MKRRKSDIPAIAPVNPISKILRGEPLLLNFLGRCWNGFPDTSADFPHSCDSFQLKFFFWR
jgi:hypothetical protein